MLDPIGLAPANATRGSDTSVSHLAERLSKDNVRNL